MLFNSKSVGFVRSVCLQDVSGGDQSEETVCKQLVSWNVKLQKHESLSLIPYMKKGKLCEQLLHVT